MIKFWLCLLISCFSLVIQAQAKYKSLAVTPGNLLNLLTPAELISVTHLTLTGTINDIDWKNMLTLMPSLDVLDLSGVAFAGNEVPDGIDGDGIEGNKVHIRSIILPCSLNSIGNFAFSNFEDLTAIVIPPLVTDIGGFAFWSCVGLTSFEIPPSVATIGYDVFFDCLSLNTVIIPSSVTEIKSEAFGGCTSLASVYIDAVVPPKTDPQAFRYVDLSRCTLYVPIGSKLVYESKDPWRNFTIVESAAHPGPFTVPTTVEIEKVPAGEVCPGTSVTFTAIPLNGGIPAYQWKKGGVAMAGQTNPTYTSGTLQDGDEITVEMLPSHCNVTGKPVTSNTVTITLTSTLPVSVSIASSANQVCPGTPVFYTATPGNAGQTPAYQWKVNGVNVGGNSTVFSYVPLKNDAITCVLTSGSDCSTGNEASSNTITMSIHPAPVSAFTFTEDSLNSNPGQLLLSNGSVGATNYFWDLGNGMTSEEKNPTVYYEKDSTYTIRLKVTSAEGCTDTASATYILMTTNLFMPNAFSPSDTDPEVKIFKPSGSNLKAYKLEIYNRWNNLVWFTDKLTENGEPAEGWDGNINGEPAPLGVYLWKVFGIFKNGEVYGNHLLKKFPKRIQGNQGTVTLMR